jgi:hypothetical protein
MMGFKKDWDINQIKHYLWAMYANVSSHHNDGFIQWSIKQDMYEIKWLVDNLLAKCPEFTDEAEFLKQHEQEVLIEVLKS